MDPLNKNNHTNSDAQTTHKVDTAHRLGISSNINIDIIQANIQHSVTGFAALRRTLEEQPNTIALVQEPYINRGKVSGFNALRGTVFVPAMQNKSRTFIYIPNPYKASLITHLCNDDLTVVKLETGLCGRLSTVVLASVYMDIGAEAPPPALEDLVQFCTSNNLEFVVGGDANAHCTIWGCPDTNDRGKDMLDFILRHDLNLLNKGSEPTFVTSWAKTIIDITIATSGIADTISDWRVATNEISCADHRRIRFSIKVGEHKPRTYRNPKKTDKSLFGESLEKELSVAHKVGDNTKMTPQDIEEIVNSLTNSMIVSYEKSCPLKTENNKIQHKKDRWWTRKLSKLRKKVRHHFNRAMNTNKSEDWQEYRKKRHRLKVEIIKSRDNSWKKYSNSIQSESETARLKKILSGNTQIKLGTLKKADGTYTSSDREQFELLLQTHFPDCRLDHDEKWETETTHEPVEEDWAFADSIVTEEALLWATSTFQPYKAAGTDGIFPALLHWSFTKIKSQLIAVYRACLAWKYIPKAWREVKVIFLPKPGKSDYTNPKSFRPISLSSFLLKTLERLCDKYIRSGPLADNPVNNNQHAYQTGKSTETALHQVVHKIESALENKQSCLATFIDIEGAFDKTMFDSIENGLSKHGVDNRVNKWITNMLSNRAASIETTSSTRCLVTRGCPQGGVLSPLLWVVVANELIELLNADGVTTVGYADDMAIMVSGLFEATLCDKMQRALRIVEKWCDKHSLSVNPQKTEMVLFTRKLKLTALKLPTLFGTELSLSKEVKYLGVWLDNKLLWSKHLDHIITKATNILWQVTRTVGKDWGLKPKLCRWLYTVVVRPVLTYGCVVWWTRTILITTINKLQQTQRLACSLISGCSKSTPSAALDTILGLTPLHLHIQQEAMAAALRIKSTNQWKGDGPTTKHCRIIDRAIRFIPEASKGTDKVANTHLDGKRYELATEDHDLGDISSSWNIYTDGSKNKTGVGCGFHSPELGLAESVALNKTTTVMQAEAIGLLLATRAVASADAKQVSQPQKGGNTIIFTVDNAAVIYALKRPTTRSKVITECHTALQKLANNHRTIVKWTRSHGPCEGNRRADTLAKEGAKKQANADVLVLCKPSAMEVRNLLCRHTEKEQQKLWDKRTDCKHAKAAFPTLDKKITNNLLKLPRQDLRLMVGLITGHCNLNYHLHKTGATDSSLCRGCLQEDETVEHVMFHCAATEAIRLKTGMREQITKIHSTHSSSHQTSNTLELLCQQPRAPLRYIKELGWLG